MKDYLYLDYAANTPVDEEVLKTFNNATLKYFANPNATHGLGVEVNEKIIKELDSYGIKKYHLKKIRNFTNFLIHVF